MALDEKLLSRKEVRLFPTSHIRSVREAECRATASFLAMARAVSEFGKAVVSMAGGPKGRIRCYTEVPFKTQAGPNIQEDRPDGILRSTYGKKDWIALVEVKVGDNLLEQVQIDRYHKIAKEHGFNALITISNQSALSNGLPPGVKANKPLLKSIPIVHFSWERLLSEAQLLSSRKAIADTDQQWMLHEWIQYLTDPQSRIIEPPELGPEWHKVLRFAREGSLSACKIQIQDVVEHWNGFLRKVALRLRAKLGVDVMRKISNAEKKDPSKLIKNLATATINDGQLPGVFRIPGAAGDLSVVVLLKSRTLQYSTDVKAPMEGKSKTRINWLFKQLSSEDVPEDLIIKVNWGYRRLSQGRIGDLRGHPDRLLWDSNGEKVQKKDSPNSFSLQWTHSLPGGKGRSTAPILEGIAEGIEDFYRRVLEKIQPYVAKAPQLPKAQTEEILCANMDANENCDQLHSPQDD